MLNIILTFIIIFLLKHWLSLYLILILKRRPLWLVLKKIISICLQIVPFYYIRIKTIPILKSKPSPECDCGYEKQTSTRIVEERHNRILQNVKRELRRTTIVSVQRAGLNILRRPTELQWPLSFFSMHLIL